MNIPNVKHFRHKVVAKVKKHVKKLSKAVYEKGDPDFVDERKKSDLPEKEESFFDFLFNFGAKK